jgi:hypothetical protein
LLEAASSTAEGEHNQASSKEDPSIPHPPKRLMLALFFTLFIETMAVTIAIQISSQGRESFHLFHLGGVIGPIVDVIVAGVFFVVLAIYFRFRHADVKDKAFFGIFFTAGTVLGLATEALIFIVAHEVKNNAWLNHFGTTGLTGMFLFNFVAFLLAFLIGHHFVIRFIGGDKWDFQAVLGNYHAGLILGYFMSLLLAVANWGLQEGARPKLLSVMLAFFLSGTVAYFLAAMIALAQIEVKDDDKEDEGENPTSALVAK